jgi:hypothetical protein
MNCLDLYRLIYDNATTLHWSGSLLQCTILHCRSHVVPGTQQGKSLRYTYQLLEEII